MSTKTVLLAENLRKTYVVSGGKNVVAVNDVSMNVVEGEIFALLGPNGAGKTTTIKMASGLLLPNTGAVRINGLDPYKDRTALKYIGSVLEGNRNLYWRMTARENLVYFGVLKGVRLREARSRSLELLDQFGLRDKEKAQVQKLSRGMQQRLAIAISLVHRPRLLLLDEPALGLDARSTVEIKKMIRALTAEGVGVLLTTHQLDIAEEISTRIAIMNGGKIINEGVTGELLKRYANDSYAIDLMDDIDEDRRARLEAQTTVTFAERSVVVSCAPEELYEILNIVRPLHIHSVNRHESDLSSVFLRLTADGVPGNV